MKSGVATEGNPAQPKTAFFCEQGPVRKNNQDCILLDTDKGLFVVADGMGGHSDGAYASAFVCEHLSPIILEGSLDDRITQLASRLSEANRQLFEYAGDRQMICGTTVVALLVLELEAAVIWAGDSRLYHWVRQSVQIRQVTRDHDGTESLPEQVREFAAKRSHMISRAIGVRPTVDVDIVTIKLATGDRLLLCSDGLHGVLEDSTISSLLSLTSLQAASDGLMQAAVSNATRDNLSAVLVEIA
jgi:serine/threonine-protein phosphatase Stp1